MRGRLFLVSAAFTAGGDLSSWLAYLDGDGELAELDAMLRWLFKLGHLAAFSIGPAPRPLQCGAVFQELAERLGDVIVGAVRGCPFPAPEPPPAYLVPMWPFDHEHDGFRVSMAKFLGVDVEVSAVPSFDEETGFSIPGCEGLYLPLILPSSVWLRSEHLAD